MSPHIVAHFVAETARADEPALIKSRTAHDGAVEASTAQVASDETRPPEVGTRKIGAIQKNVVKLRLVEIGIGNS